VVYITSRRYFKRAAPKTTQRQGYGNLFAIPLKNINLKIKSKKQLIGVIKITGLLRIMPYLTVQKNE
jgi:hypothetical protein